MICWPRQAVACASASSRTRCFGYLWFNAIVTAVLFVLMAANIAIAQGAVLGFNKFELATQYTGRASGGDGSERYQKATIAMARKSLADAREAGVRLFRISATGYAPSVAGQRGDLDLWVKEPPRYWAQMDLMFVDLDAAGVQIVPSFIWNAAQFPAMNGETVRELISDAKSPSYQMAERYVTEFVERYKARKTVLFYELTNELNLLVDLDMAGRCNRQSAPANMAALCKVKGNFTTDEMIGFTRRLAAAIRTADGSRQISSGFSVPRAAAEHLRARPEWINGTADFTPDSLAQFQRNIADTHAAVDIVSVHLYPTPSDARFGSIDPTSTSLLQHAYEAALKSGKPLFVGEFGDSVRSDARPDAYMVRMIDRIVELKVPYSAVWAWEFYLHTPYQTRETKDTAFSLEPGFTDELIQKIAQTNARLGSAPPKREANDTTPPRLVLTWPLECTQAKSLQGAHAVASDDSGQVKAVEFLVDGKLVVQVARPPYNAVINTQNLAAGEHVLKARAMDAVGNLAEAEVTLVVGAGQLASCKRAFPQ